MTILRGANHHLPFLAWLALLAALPVSTDRKWTCAVMRAVACDTVVAQENEDVTIAASGADTERPAKSANPLLPLKPALRPEAEVDELFEKLKRILPSYWTVSCEGKAFEFRGPYGWTRENELEEAQITFWFADAFADSNVLRRRGRKLPEIGSWGPTRLGQALFTRNEAAIQFWPEFLDAMYWWMPVEHVALAGVVDFNQRVDEQEPLFNLMNDAGTRIDVEITAEGNRKYYMDGDDFRTHVEDYGLARESDLLVIGKLPEAAADTDQDRLRLARHKFRIEQMKKGAREYGVPIVSLADYVAYLRELKRAGRAKQLRQATDGNRIEIPHVPVAETRRPPVPPADEFPILRNAEGDSVIRHEGVIEEVTDTMILFPDRLAIPLYSAMPIARLTEKGEVPTRRQDLKPHQRVRYDLVLRKGLSKVVILP